MTRIYIIVIGNSEKTRAFFPKCKPELSISIDLEYTSSSTITDLFPIKVL